MRYEILGQLRVVDEIGTRTISAKKAQVVLALMLVMHGQVVSGEKLIFEIWRDRPPSRAMAGVHVYISQVRKFLESGHPDSGSRIVTTASGYMLELGNATVDFEDFNRGFEQGKAHHEAGRHEEAIDCFNRSLQLWPGSSPDDIADGPVLNSFFVCFREMRLECIELRASSGLSLGRHREIVGSLYSLVHEHPLHEDFYHKLMLALYRSGRRADALSVYQAAREVLRVELGLEPSQPLRQLQRRILAVDSFTPDGAVDSTAPDGTADRARLS